MNRTKPIILGVAVCFAIIAGFFWYGNLDEDKKDRSREGLLSDIPEAAISPERESAAIGQELDEKSVIVENLEPFGKLMKEDPILFEGNLNAADLDRALEKLGNHERELMGKMSYDGKLYPFSFLRAFSDSSRQIPDLLKNNSAQNAVKVIALLEKTADAYLSDAEMLKKELEKIKEAPGGQSKIAYLGGESYSEVAVMLKDIDLMIENGRMLQKEVEARKKCLTESVDYCKSPLEKISKPKAVVFQSPEEANAKFIPEEFRNTKPGVEYTGPFEVNSSCWSNGQQHYFLVPKKECLLDDELCVDVPILADNAYFSRTSDFIEEEKKLRESGVKYVPQSSTASYACIDIQYKQKLKTLVAYLKLGEDGRIFKKIINKKKSEYPENFFKLLKEGEAAEEKFFDAKYPSQSALENLADWYLYVYSQDAKNNLLDPESKDLLLENAHLIKGGFVELEKTINSVDLLLLRMINDPSWGSMSPTPLYVFATRTNYSLFFLNFSSNVWRLEKKPAYFISAPVSRESALPYSGNIINFEKAKEMFGEDEIRFWIESYRKNILKR